MTCRLLTAIAIATAAGAGEPVDDVLRFANGDQLHGRFGGIGERGHIRWQRGDVDDAVDFETHKVRQVVLHGGRPARGIETVTHARLVGGDRLPGTIVELDQERLVLETPYAGRLSIPRDRVDVLAPQPFGGCIHYAGPFQPDGWRIILPEDEKGAEEQDGDADPFAQRVDNDGAGEAEGEQADSPPWAFARTAWYSVGNASAAPLVRDDGMSDATLLRFRVAWRDQIGLSIAFHADFASPPELEDGEEKREPVRRGTLALPFYFGNCYVLSLKTTYAMMYRCGFDEEGKLATRRMQNPTNNVRLSRATETEIELRCDRRSGRIVLFVDGEFAMQWDESHESWAGKGSGFGFLVEHEDSKVRLSDILVADWNGMIDSARSMDVPDRDVVLLSNGTDRFSGKVTGIADDHLVLDGSYATMRIPLSRVAEIHFARDQLAAVPEANADQVVVHIHPLGRLAGKALRASQSQLSLDSPQLGEIDLSLDYANLLEFQAGGSFVDDWDVSF